MRIPVLFCLVVLATGCSAPSGEVDDSAPVKSKIILNLREVHVPDQAGPPQPALLLVTSEWLECCNYEILTHVETRAGVLEVDILGMDLPGGVCLTAFGPAHAQVSIPTLSECTRITVRQGVEVDQYSLAVDDSTFRMSGQEGQFTRPGDTLVWRFPKRSMVYTCGTLAQDSCLCQKFRDSLLAHLNLQSVAVPTPGNWPYPRETIGYYYNMDALVYQYSTESEFQRAGAILAAFTRAELSSHEGIGLALINWRNEQFASWLIRDSANSRR